MVLPSNNISLAIIQSTSAPSRANGISFQIVDPFAVTGYTIAVTHKMSKILAILLPNIFQIARSVFHSIAANTFTANSGLEVQKATIVSPITSGGILARSPRALAQDTSKSAHLISMMNPRKKSI